VALVFQYGSNLDAERLNGLSRLRGDARVIGKAVTQDDYEFVFDIWSESEGGHAAADIVSGSGRRIWGVIYEVPDYLMSRKMANAKGRKSFDEVEGEGSNYERTQIRLNWPDGRPVAKPVITYIGKNRRTGIKTTAEYVRHILKGLAEHRLPRDYEEYVRNRILENNPELGTLKAKVIGKDLSQRGLGNCRR
jgi:hypothetical protein